MNDAQTLILLGGGGHATVVADAASLTGRSIAGYVDETESVSQQVERLPRLGNVSDLSIIIHDMGRPVMLHAAVGDNTLRRRWMQTIGRERFVTIIHPTAVVASTAHIDEGVFIGPRAIINPYAHLGPGTIINSAAIVEHDCQIAGWSHIAPGAVLTGDVRIGSCTLIGSGAIVTPGVSIGDEATIGAGAVALTDVAAHTTCAGVPARQLYSVEFESKDWAVSRR